jgi:serine/threonine protein phosphatase PrpC
MFSLASFGNTSVGKVRKRNEDAYSVSNNFTIVADGMGGHKAGDIAARMAIDAVGAFISDSSQTISSKDEAVYLIRMAFEKANRKVFAEGLTHEHEKGMGTTLVAAWLVDNHVIVANVGDSRCYHIRDGFMKQITNDHSWIAEQMKAGVIMPDEASTFVRFKNVITRSIGFKEDLIVDSFEISVKPGDIFALCSDGLTNMVTDEQLGAIGGDRTISLEDRVTKIIELANANGGMDNITVVLSEVRQDR